MTDALLPSHEDLSICFAHHAYDLKATFDARETGMTSFQVSSVEDLRHRLPEADVLVCSGLWHNDMLEDAPRLRFLQSVSSGTNAYDLAAFREHGVMLASGAGANMNAVSEHAMALLLALTRRLGLARDKQARRTWGDEQSDPSRRARELPGRTLLLVGLGHIGNRIALLARAFGMRVTAVRRNAEAGRGHADEVHPFGALPELIPAADAVVLCCPLTDETANLIDADALSRFRPDAVLINVARGGCVDEPALIEALRTGTLAGAGLDVTATEPLPGNSPLWDMENVILTPHTAGETAAFEGNVIDILIENLSKLRAGNADLTNRAA
ncbi:hydroxyacid dehydrogenase [Roseivivax halodurans JCM 10272]|uniref:Hydroxyacid dehydrogenase n=1 Tax=Roseivivax halodurans JCM 10272 TaxID=1449350 RepID=X7EJE4_9RHOB|nr:D-2-hydroxyacid dehydrogenase [Roseivivax halodurans]ETX16032.1 hydroxyacid dehydrogenase [Roseivivax halodurans JCM 10272]